MTFHSMLTANHVPYAGIFATESARLAGVNLTVADVGKEYLQSDNNTHWMLAAFLPSLVWVRTDPAVKQPTTADIALYLDSVAGSDDNDGSVSAPFKTFTRAFRDIKNLQIDHVVKLKPAAGIYTDFPEYLYLSQGPNGALVIDASGETYPVADGPFTIGAVNGVGPPDIWGVALATDLQVTPNPSWTIDDYYGKFIHFLTGSLADYVFPIFKNTGDVVRTVFDLFSFGVGDTFEIVDPPVKIQVDHTIAIVGVTVNESFWGQIANNIYMAGLEFEIDTGAYNINPLYFNNIDIILSLVRIIDMYNDDEWSIPLIVQNSSINFGSTPAGIFDNAELENWFAYAFSVLGRAGSIVPDDGFDILVYGSSLGQAIASLTCRRKILAATDNSNVSYILCGGVSNTIGAIDFSVAAGSLIINTLFIEQISFNDIALEISNHNLIIESCYIDKCDLPIKLTENVFCLCQWLKGANIANANALEINRGSQFQIETAANVTIIGITNVAKWLFDNAVVATWPTTGNFVSKVNSFIVTE